MARRPDHIDLSRAAPASYDALSRPLFTPHGTSTTPQGEVPPALSPLDAFAMQSRMLARRFEQPSNDGKRLSRLAHTTIAQELSKPRPDYSRNISGSSTGNRPPSPIHEDDRQYSNVGEVHSAPRPLSHYPQMITTDSYIGHSRNTWYQNQLDQVEEYENENENETPSDAGPGYMNNYNSAADRNYVSIPRTQSPDHFDSLSLGRTSSSGPSGSPHLPSATSSSSSLTSPKYSLGHSYLAPPGQPRTANASPGMRPTTADVTDDFSRFNLESENAMAGGFNKFVPPFSNQSSFTRSPSLASDKSASSLTRPSFNFSRPISRQSRPSGDSYQAASSPYRQNSQTRAGVRAPFDPNMRQDSTDSPSTPFMNEAPSTPVSLASEELFLPSHRGGDLTPTSFVYAKYALGPKSKRESVAMEDFLNKQFNWDDPTTDSQLNLPLAFHKPMVMPQSPPSPALTSSPPSGRRRNRPQDIFIPGLSQSPRPSLDFGIRKKLLKSRPTTPTTVMSNSDASTIKPLSALAKSPASTKEKSSEEHLQMGIDLHEAGSLQQSTYHLRLAAKAGHPTAMLLYALACRHGWGMKPSASEGVLWLKQAVDTAQFEVEEDEIMVKNGQSLDVGERKSHKAQFALGVFELGQSYMNGWGINQDKTLGLKCFEIAGNWGDGDALAEAALCYMEGIGCKKDMKKSARLYRQAEAKGVKVAGNSWIHKDKYLEEEHDERGRGRISRKDSDESQKRGKSRTRAFFARKKN